MSAYKLPICNIFILKPNIPFPVMFTQKIANLINKLNFYKLIPYPTDNLLNRSAQTGPPNVRKRRPVLDRVLTYKNLIYLLNLQFYCVNTSYPMDNLLNNYRLVGG